nr:GNAT family N-acetyltransferase [Thermohalobacter berrensis]
MRKRKWVQLDNIAVKSDYQNKRIGSMLLEKVIEWSRNKDIKRIELNVYTFNDKAIQFYNSKNFKDLKKTMYLDL